MALVRSETVWKAYVSESDREIAIELKNGNEIMNLFITTGAAKLRTILSRDSSSDRE